MAGYIICTTPRSGSTLLCRLLGATGRAGQPDSFYHEPAFMQEWADAWGVAAPGAEPAATRDLDYLRAAIAAGRGDTGLFGMRLQRPHLPRLRAALSRLQPAAARDVDRLAQAFGQTAFLHLTRLDKVAQAVSLVKARQSGLWHVLADGRELERLGPPHPPAYDRTAIAQAVHLLTQDDKGWHRWFRAQGVEPLRIPYEDLASDPPLPWPASSAISGSTRPTPARSNRPSPGWPMRTAAPGQSGSGRKPRRPRGLRP